MLKRFGMVASVLALLALALAGCKNGMLGEDEATVNGLRDAGDRTAFVTVRNFVEDGSGPLRTIAPDTPDVKTGYKFIAEGRSGRNVLPATLVEIDQATGRVDLANLAPGLWTITLTAYDENLLGGDTDAAAIVAKKGTAAVLSGSATVNLTSRSGDVVIILTPRNVGTEGEVNLRVNFNSNDQTKIQNSTGGTYEVKIGLYDRTTGEPIMANAQSTEQDKTTNVKANRLVDYNLGKVPVGEYTFKVTITDTTIGSQKGPWYWSDNLIVLGNIDLDRQVEVDELLGGAEPAAPANLAAYWASSKTKADGSEYTVHFAWDRKSFNESGFELQIADITEYFNTTNSQYDNVAAVDADNLWTQIDAKNHDNVTTITEKDFARVDYPIYDKQGSLVAGSTYVDYALPTGRLYTARLRARNANGESNWVNLQAGGTDPASKWQDGGVPPAINVTDAAKLNGYYFDVFSVTYQLGNAILLKQGEQAATAAVKGDVDFHAFAQGAGYEVKYKVAQNNADNNNYQLYPASFAGQANFDGADRIKSWSGWSNSTDKADTKVYSNQPDVKYEGSSNVTLIPAGASGGLLVDVIGPGDFADLLTEDTVFIQLKEEIGGQTSPQGALTWAGKEWDAVTTDIKTNGTSEVGEVNGKKGIRLPDTIQTNVKDFLCVAVGKSDAEIGTLDITTAQGTRTSSVYRMTLTLEQNGTVIASGTSGPGDDYVYCDVTQLSEGDYTLRLMVTPMEGWPFSFQRPFVVKCSSTVIP
ncbi:MAG: hypothetical protein IJX45_09760 [Spirochaetaceae bacterium]|nr:hypothetical protein [Spirochaetaceae bacterium]MBQ8561326.1 hypothetical protein [Spirochaetaceae bacterium]